MSSTVEINLSGVCGIKSEFLVKDHERNLSIQHVASDDLSKLKVTSAADGESPSKKPKFDVKKKLKGQNKDRRRGDVPAWKKEPVFCPDLTDRLEEDLPVTEICTRGDRCKFQHDAESYLSKKPPDIGTTCYVYRTNGYCPWGISCRFGGDHLKPNGANLKDVSVSSQLPQDSVSNVLDKETVNKLWKKKYDFGRTEEAVKLAEKLIKTKKKGGNCESESADKEVGDIADDRPGSVDIENGESHVLKEDTDVTEDSDIAKVDSDRDINGEKHIGCVDDTDTIKIRMDERKKLNWGGLLYLSPLTTVGNLPFRRICVEYGADITCSEMTLALSLLQGTREWSLVKRHPSETIYGVQVCGNNPMIMTKVAQLLEEKASVDFIDINLGCPIDALYIQGCGSGMMCRRGLLNRTCVAMSTVLRDTPLTVKLRTGVTSTVPLAHSLMPLFRSSGVSLATVHGRSREQRYTRNADWHYINQCADAASPMPVFGNGDILSYEDYLRFMDTASSCSGAMIGRGALIKPWIFREIKERKHLDISSSERFDIVKKYVNYGLEHWGSDTRGVETTRRFLLEWLSFLYRYVPVGILERVPQAINQRPPVYRGRNDMETLMASANCSDWVKISEMLLGPVPEGFVFLPKHKSNAWK